MDTQTTVKKRSFDLLHISEEEGAVLCALVILSDKAMRKQLETEFMDCAAVSLDEAVRIGCELRDQINTMVWEA